MKSSLVRIFRFSVMAASVMAGLASMPVAAATPVPGVSGQALAEPGDVAAFRQSVGGDITAVIVELKDEPGAVRNAALEQTGQTLTFAELGAYSVQLIARQDEFLAALPQRGVRAVLKQADVAQIDGSVRHVEWRFSYLLNGFVAYVATADLQRLREQPEVMSVEIPEPAQFHLDKAIDYSLGTAVNVADRRLAVYGNTQELVPLGSPGHPETPRTSALDGFEGQNINLAVIDSGVDWRHPMFGGTGLTTPTPRVSGNPTSASDNTKVVYYYSLSSPGDPTDDFGHGTHTASCAAGYKVDGNTPANPGFGTGRDGMGIGPTINSAVMHGTAPQARILAYKVCGPSPNCAGDIPLAIEDAASPFTLVSSGSGGPTPVAKPVADVINLSLGSPAGNPTSASSRASNNAALAGTIVVASAGNSGPGLGTVGDSSVATLVISVAASLDPGSTAVGDVLAPNQIPNELNAGGGPPTAVAGPPEETGAASDANSPQPGERQAMTLFSVAGGGPIPGGSVSAHLAFVDLRPAGATPPVTVTNRIAVVKFAGAFAAAANSVASLNPAAILLITTVESATAVAVVNGIPTYTIGPNNGNYLIDRMRTGDPGDGDDTVDVPQGTVSELPMRLAESAALASFQPSMAGFSSRGPNDHPGGNFRTVKPDVTAPGVGITGAATPDGLPGAGMANTSGYVTANGTSFSGPITAGAMILVRQRVRALGLDAITQVPADPNYRAKRFDTVTVARALLQNNATNLRSGLGMPTADGLSAASINDMGSGHINVAGALAATAVMISPVMLLKDADPVASGDQREFNPPTLNPPTLVDGNLEVLLPTASFGPVPVVGLDATLVKTKKVIVRDVTGGQGAGAYNLTFQNNRNADIPGFSISFLAADGTTPATSVDVPAGGTAEFLVRVAADGTQIQIPDLELQWYVTATHASSGRTLRMPFYYRAVLPVVQNIIAPLQGAPTFVETPAADPACGTDTNGSYTVNFSYTKPAGGPAPVGFRVQEGTRSQQVYFDNADEPLVAGANSKWTGTNNWSSQANPNTGSLAYFVPDTSNQNEILTMVGSVPLAAGGATLTFDTNQDTEANFDFVHVEVSIDNGASYQSLGKASGRFAGTRQFDMSGFAGNSAKIRFRMTSDLIGPAPGWHIENIRITSDDFRTIANTAADATSQAVTVLASATYIYRIAGIFVTPDGNVAGPYSNNKCIKVEVPAPPADPMIFRDGFEGP